jgi:uncharacterized protein with PQ loop repeat
MQMLGWLATAVFTCSYLAKKDSTLRWIQAVAAILWITYGMLIHAMPVVVANSLVAVAAIISTWRRRTTALASPTAQPN